MYKVSVIVPAYNAEPYIEQCARSLLNQSLSDIELIFINDGSTDNTGRILDQLTAEYENAMVIHQNNQGLYKTREIGLKKASGSYVGWVDADDYVEPTMFEKLYYLVDGSNSEMAYCSHDFVPKKIKTKEKWFVPFSGTVNAEFVEKNCQPWNKIVKRELLERLDVGPKFKLCFDEIYIKVMMVAKNPVYTEEELYHYRVNEGSMSASYDNYDHFYKIVEASKRLKEEVSGIIGTDQYWIDYFDYRIIYYWLTTALTAANAGNKNVYDASINELKKMDYQHNQHFDRLMKRNFGALKSFVMGRIIPWDYHVARTICRLAL